MQYDFLRLNKLGGEFAKLYESVEANKNVYAYSLDKGSKAHVASYLDRFVLYVTSDRVEARAMYDVIAEHIGCERVGLLLEKDDILLYNKSNQSFNIAERMKTLGALVEGSIDVLVVPAEVLEQYLPNRRELERRILHFTKGEDYSLSAIVESLVSMSYSREEVVNERGTFSQKGDILSVFPYDSEPIRMSFFDTELESIKEYDVETMMSVRELKSVEILPCTDMIFDTQYITEYTNNIDKLVADSVSTIRGRLQEIVGDIAFELEQNSASPSLSWITPFVRKGMDNIFEYIPSDAVIIFDEPKVIDDRIKLYAEDTYNRVNTLLDSGEVVKTHKYSLIHKDTIYKNVSTYTCVAFENIASMNPIFKGDTAIKFRVVPLPKYHMNYPLLVSDLKSFLETGVRVVLCAGNKDTAKNMCDSLCGEGIGASYSDTIGDLERGVIVTPFAMSTGFNYSARRLVVIGTDELIRKRAMSMTRKNKKRVFTIPKVGDYVVHDIHGIGLCQGIERMKFSDIERDYVVIQYKGSDKLYLPIDQLDRLSRYSGSEKAPTLSKFGGKEFERVKAKVKESIKEMAINLLDLYAERRKVKGYKYEPDTDWERDFENAFEFEETEDQLTAIAEIKKDMESGVVMDRLLCGDVGFGKTEVALRAVFKTIIEGKQAAILAPTTILARQHYNTVLSRFDGFGMKAVLLSRFQSKKEIKEALAEIKSGKASIIVATHRILSSDVEFNDLGLLVLDEEQRFGVEHKEKLKLLNKNVNILTLSATPIPRTLNMALTGVRDISLLETPPVNRLPIQTYVTELSDALITDAIQRELARGGQVFILYNRVNTIERFACHVSDLVPEANVIIGHGQMDSRELEDSIMKFYNKEANVLICTTIIENGIDLPDANTLIVCDADRLGLSALYQLRGRVGRSNRMAYAYFTVKEGKVLTSDAVKRLNAIMDYTDFGSGFKIAMRDLEIRGAGNILGKEQHGHIAKVGYDMYCKLLEETVHEVECERDKVAVVKNDGKGVEINAELDAYIPDSYISSSNEKMRIYTRIADIRNEEDRQTMLSTLQESYGVVPRQVENLIGVGFIKNMANTIGASRVNITSKMTNIELKGPECIRNEGLAFALSDMQDECILMPTTKPMIVFEGKDLTNVNKLNQIIKFLKKSNGIF